MFKKVRTYNVFWWTLAIINSVNLVINLSDYKIIELYHQRLSKKYLNLLFGSSAQEVYSVIGGLNIILAIFGLAMFSFCLFKIYKSILNKSTTKKFFIPKALIIIFIIVTCIRGGWQKRPISIATTLINTNGKHNIANLVNNSLFNLIRSKPLNIPNINLENISLTPAPNTKLTDKKNFIKPKNIIFIAVESMNTVSLKKINKNLLSIVTNLNLKKHEYYFTDSHQGNADFSRNSLFTVFYSVPYIFEFDFLNSTFKQNFHGFIEELNQNNFNTLFVHGSKRGSQQVSELAEFAKFNQYISARSDTNPNINQKTMFGVNDEYLYEVSLDEFKKQTQPFFATIFTSSTHRPFHSPNNPAEKNDFQRFMNALTYSFEALNNFLLKLKSQPFFKETLIIITSDHSPMIFENDQEESDFFPYTKLPLLIISPRNKLRDMVKTSKSQHLDLATTILDLLDLPAKKPSFYGRSILKNNNPYIFTSSRGNIFYSQFEDCKYEWHLKNEQVKIIKNTDNCENKLAEKEIKKYVYEYIYRIKNNKVTQSQ